MDGSVFSRCMVQVIRSRLLGIGVIVFAVLCLASPANAQDDSTGSTAILERLERLERDNDELRRKLERVESSRKQEPAFDDSAAGHVARSHAPSGWVYTGTEPEAVFTEAEAGPVLDESIVRSIVAEELAMLEGEHETSVPAPVLTETQELEKKLAELDRSFKAFEQKSTKKTYPNVTVNGVFQADAGWIHQDANSSNQYGEIKDGSDFRRARLPACPQREASQS